MVKPIEVTPSIMELRMLFHIMTRKILTCPRRATWGISESKEVFLMEPHRIGAHFRGLWAPNQLAAEWHACRFMFH